MQWSVSILEFYFHYTLIEAHNRSICLHRDPPESYGDPLYPPPLDIDGNNTVHAACAALAGGLQHD